MQVTMEEVEESEANRLDSLGEKLAKNLIDNTKSTLTNIGSVLSLTFRGSINSRTDSRLLPAISLPEKGIVKTANKYTLRIKSCGSVLAEDGYKWRKYGQKSIKNSPNPRSYYRCMNPRCNAKKQVERSMDDPEMLIVTYEGLHLHYTYSHFLRPRPQDSPTTGLHLSKKPKTQNTIINSGEEQRLQQKQQQKQTEKLGEGNKQDGFVKDFMTKGLIVRDEDLQHGMILEEEQSPQGLLGDVVPWSVRNPCSTTASSNDQSFSYSQSSPSYSSTFSWSPAYSYLDEGILPDLIQGTSL